MVWAATPRAVRFALPARDPESESELHAATVIESAIGTTASARTRPVTESLDTAAVSHGRRPRRIRPPYTHGSFEEAPHGAQLDRGRRDGGRGRQRLPQRRGGRP